MAITPELLAILRCPRCRGDLRMGADGASLACDACSLAYPVRDGFAVLIKEEALPLGPAGAAGGRRP